MKTMKNWRNIFVMCSAVLSFASCSSDEPKYADPEAHEKTVLLNEQYGPLIVGTWHYENISDSQRYFERLTFLADGTLTGMRKWQTRKLVTIDGEQRYTDWENVEPLEGTFSGTWKLSYYSPEGVNGAKRNCLFLNAQYEGANSGPPSTTPMKRRFDSKDFTLKTRMDGLPSFAAIRSQVSNKQS